MRFKKFTPDIIVIAVLLLVTASLFAVSILNQEQGNTVVVEIDGVLVKEYPLSQNGTFLLGSGTNTLVIEDGAAYMSDSNCPDHTCENTGKIHYVGQTIVCLPNRITITVKGEMTDDGVDLVS